MYPSYAKPQSAAFLPADSTAPPALPVLAIRLQRVYQSALPKLSKHVLCYLCWRVDKDTWQTWVSLKRMARELGIGRSTLERTLKCLQTASWIERIPRLGHTTLLRLRPEAFTAPRSEAAGQHGTDSAGRLPAVPSVDGRSPAAGRQASRAGTQSVLRSAPLPASKSSGDDWQPLSEEMRKIIPELTPERFAWAVERIRGRMRTPAQSRAYWSRSLARLFENFAEEVESYMVERATKLRQAGVGAGVADELYRDAIAHGLPYDHVTVNAAIDAADARLARDATLRSELNVGRLDHTAGLRRA